VVEARWTGFPGLTGDPRGPLEGIDEARGKEMDEARWEGSGPAVESVPWAAPEPGRLARVALTSMVLI